jgi:hypothetical protein
LNLTRLNLGIAHESQFQGLGIRYRLCETRFDQSPACGKVRIIPGKVHIAWMWSGKTTKASMRKA